MSDGGYKGWATPAFDLGFRLDGAWLFGSGVSRPHDVALPGPGVVFPTLAEEDVLQLRYLAGDVPVGVQPQSVDLPNVWLDSEATYWVLESARQRGAAVDAYLDRPIVDMFAVGRAGATQATWQLSRPAAWSVVPGVDTTTRPPAVLLDGVALSAAGSSPPSANEYYVPAADADGFVTLETEAGGLSGTWLEVRYHALHRVRVTDLRVQLRETNGLYVSLRLEELRQRRWSL